jgi:undecaprenyl-diphosphatase
MDQIKAIIMGLVEGLTEFIPVSSTGHLILAKSLLKFQINDTFEVFIQIGAILAVILLYRQRFIGLLDFKRSEGFAGFRGLFLLGLTTVPAFIVGFLLHGFIKDHLFNPTTVALGLGVGGIWILVTEKWLKLKNQTSVDQITWKQALAIGCFQCLALWPGMSRSSSTILGAMMMGLDRKSAAEYSFFAAAPLLVAAGVFDLLDNLSALTLADIPLFATGLIVSFLSAWLAIRVLIRFVSHHTLSVFGWYRLALMLIVFWLVK